MKRDDEWVWVPFQVELRHAGLRIDRFLAERLHAQSRTRVQRILEEARVLRNGRAVRSSAKVRSGEIIEVAYPRKHEAPLAEGTALPVLFEDDDFLIINKPAGLLSHPTHKTVLHTVTGILKATRNDLRSAHLLHRLDRDTSGVIALAKNAEAARGWTRSMERREIHKEYIAIVQSVPEPRQGMIDRPIGREGGAIQVRQSIDSGVGAVAVTDYEVEHMSPDQRWSVVRCRPRTGRLHQIRVHMASIGHPLLGDPLYHGDGQLYMRRMRGQATADELASLGFPRVALHAAELRFEHPRTHRAMRVAAPLPEDMARFIGAHPFSDTLSLR